MIENLFVFGGAGMVIVIVVGGLAVLDARGRREHRRLREGYRRMEARRGR